MTNKYPKVRLDEISNNISRPFPLKKKEKAIFVNTGDVSKGAFLHQNYSNVAGLPGQAKKAILNGDILFSEIRPGNGRYARVNFEIADDFVVSTKFMILVLNHELMDSDYFYLQLTSTETLAEFQRIAESRSGTFPQITFEAISHYPFYCPDKKTQKKISSSLITINEKIELNQKTNQTLEQMAQALFKSWFVDFDPVFDNLLASVDFNLDNLETSLPDELKQKAQRRLAVLDSLKNATEYKASLSALAHELQAQLPTKEATQAAVQVSEKAAETPVKANFNGNPKILVQHANTHAHFPNEFEHNEQLGWIPKGWEVNQLSEITTELRRGISPKYIEEGGVQVINQKCIRNHEVNFTPCRRNNTELRKITGRELNVGDLLINSTGVGTLGRMAQVKYLNEVTVVDSHVTVVRADSEIYPVYSFAQMMLSIEDKIEALGHGSTGQTELSRKTVSEQWVLVPKSKALNHLNSQLISISEKIVLNSRQINELTKLRDTLLPKLISGELQIPDVATDEEIVD
ncbi:restriction endonuclease subunit S [Pseudoalteromonas sp. RB2-MNA-CIBAN-0110]|uniref:restriction endonuclease subunit S n=1 Tax=Pseudoalteromonas sp. RB2-MNA-CIBAN-0110 TaxID=3140439 RepID=UPI0033202C71